MTYMLEGGRKDGVCTRCGTVLNKDFSLLRDDGVFCNWWCYNVHSGLIDPIHQPKCLVQSRRIPPDTD